MSLDWDKWVRWGLGIAGAGTLSLVSGLALAHFTVQGTSQFYMPRPADTPTSASDATDSAAGTAANRDTNLWQLLPDAGKITRANGTPVAQGGSFDSSPN